MGLLKKIGGGLKKVGGGFKQAVEAYAGLQKAEFQAIGRPVRRVQRTIFDERAVVKAVKNPSAHNLGTAGLEVGLLAAMVVPGGAIASREAKAGIMAAKATKAAQTAKKSATTFFEVQELFHTGQAFIGPALARKIKPSPKKRTFKEAASALQKAQRL